VLLAAWSPNLVLQPIQGNTGQGSKPAAAQNMALILSVAMLFCAAAFGIACAGLGHQILRAARLEFDDDLERLLCSAALGVVTYEAALALAEFSGRLRAAVSLLVTVVVLLGAFEFPLIWSAVTRIIGRVLAGSRKEHFLGALVIAVLTFEAVAAMAPLTGSDALRYHFTAPMLILRNGFSPNFSLVHSFFIGQGHLLILTGLALGSEKLALGLIVLGGALSAAAAACLTRKWSSREWAWLSALSFLLIPVVFWQVSAAGAPDIWMAFFATTGVLAIARFGPDRRIITAFFLGTLAGALAGAKYTGCILAATSVVAFLVEAQSLRGLAPFVGGALVAGIWPYLRNALWTGDPVFPFLLRWIVPGRVNSFTLPSIIADTGGHAHLTILQLAEFPLFSAVDAAHAGFWQFYGPLCLIFAPFILLAIRNTSLWRASLIVWVGSSVAIGATTGMLRFLLPLLPVALAAVFAGAAHLTHRNWKCLRTVSFASIGVFLVACAAGLIAYGHSAASVAAGLTSREDYLRHKAPDYGLVEFINKTLEGTENRNKTMVFMQHVYYLRVPFVSGNPDASWTVDPQRLASRQSWRDFFRSENIRWIVRAPDYPPAIAAPLKQLEEEGELQPVARSEVTNFAGMRIFDLRTKIPVIILRTKD
jgi:hypothetical protein